MSVVGCAAPKSVHAFHGMDATGRPALGRRRSRLRNRKADCFSLAALDDSRLSISVQSARRYGQPRLPISHAAAC